MWSATQVPHMLRFCIAATTGMPESKIRVIAPDVGGGFGGKLQTTPEEFATLAVARKLGKPVQVHRDPLRDDGLGPPRPRPVAEADARRREGRHASPASRSSCSPTSGPTSRSSAAACRCSARGCSTRSTSSRPTSSTCQTVLHEQDVGRRLPRRRPARGDLRHRADHGRARRRGRGRPARDPREELDHARGVPVHHGGGHDLRLRQLRGGHGQGQGALRLRRAAGRAEAAPREQRPGAARHRRLDLHRDVRPRARRACSARSTTAPAAGSTRASGCCATGKVEVITGVSPHGQGHETAWSQIVADRLGVPFEDVEVLHGDTQISPKGMDTYGSRSLVVGGEAVVRAADKVIEKAKVVAAHLLEASVDDIEFTAAGSRVKGTDKGIAIPEIALAAFDRAQPARRHGARRSTPTRPSTRTTSPSRTAPTCARWRSTPRPAACTMRKYVCVDDIGKIINPLIVEGQVHGGLVAGHRPGAVRGGGVRRPGHAVDRLVRRLHAAHGGRHDQLRSPTTPTSPSTDQHAWAPRASARRAPSPRPRRSSTRSSTPCASSASTTS